MVALSVIFVLERIPAVTTSVGPKYTSTLDTVNSLGILYKNQGKLAEAEAMFSRALQGYEEALGPKHTSTIQTVNNLGALYAKQGKLAEEEAMYTRALKGYEEALGPERLSSYLPALIGMFNFGDLFSRTGRKDMAKDMYTRVLSGYRINYLDTESSKDLPLSCAGSLKVSFKGCEMRRQINFIAIAQNPRSLKQKFRDLRRRLNVR